MAEVKSYRCDICAVQKMDSDKGWVIAVLASFDGKPTVYFKPWEPYSAAERQTNHLCGAGCATKVLSKQIEAWTQPAPELPELTGEKL